MNNRPGKPPVEELDLDTLELVAGGRYSDRAPAQRHVQCGRRRASGHRRYIRKAENELRQNRGWRPGSGGGQPDHVQIQEVILETSKAFAP